MYKKTFPYLNLLLRNLPYFMAEVNVILSGLYSSGRPAYVAHVYFVYYHYQGYHRQ